MVAAKVNSLCSGGLCILAALSMLAGCGNGSSGSLYQRLQDEDPHVRIQAIKQACQQGDPDALPHMVDRLADGDRDVRVFAIIGLEKMTGRTMGYRHWAPADERDQAVARWRDWLAAGRPTDWPDTAPAASGNGEAQ